jgi:uncharacterized protein
MLIDFTLGNYRSFRDEATLSLIAAAKLRADENLDSANVFPAWQKLNLLRVAAIYGANASGKSNIIRALIDFIRSIHFSANQGFQFEAMPFLFRNSNSNAPISFEIRFLRENVSYRYGFEIKKPLTEPGTEIISEWFFQSNSSRESRLFYREGENVELNDTFREAIHLLKDKKIRRQESLLLSLSAQIGGEIATETIKFLNDKVIIIPGLDERFLRDFTEKCLESEEYAARINSLMSFADTGIKSVLLLDPSQLRFYELPDANGLSPEAKEKSKQDMARNFRIMAEHEIFSDDGLLEGKTVLPMLLDESEGTKKLFAFSATLLRALDQGQIVIIDEIDARFHPLLTQKLIGLFQSEKTNPKNAQLIFVTHDTNLLDAKRFRRDQIWFVEKDRQGASHLYSLVEFKDVRKSSNYEQDYIEGRYGALPFIGDLSRLVGEEATSVQAA